jgi:hypothetical protein
MDWMTLTIELIGFAVMILWTFIPIQEFREILTRLRHQESHPPVIAPPQEPRQ